MNRRGYLATCGALSLGGCLGAFGGADSTVPSAGTVTCADGLHAGAANGPGDGAWPTVLHDRRNTANTDAPGPSGCVETQWTWTHTPQGGISAGPVVADGHVYAPHQVIDDTRFVVLDATTGKQQWQYTNHRQQFVPSQTPTLVGDTLYLVSGHAIDAVDLQTRTSQWHLELYNELNGVEGFTPPRVANGLVYIGTDVGTVFAFDAQTGERRWTYTIDGLSNTEIPANAGVRDARLHGKVYATLGVTHKRVYVSSWDYSLYALDAMTGELHWQFSAGTDLQNEFHAPVIADGEVYMQTEDARLFVLDAETGTKKWVFDEVGIATDGVSPVVDEQSVYIVAGTSTQNLFLVALDRAERAVRWKRPIGPTFQSPVGDASTIYIDYGGSVNAIEKATGTRTWEVRLQGALSAPAAVVDEAVYFADNVNVYGIW